MSTPDDIRALRRDKYGDDPEADMGTAMSDDLERLAAGEPLAYIIGWIPFLGLKIYIEDPETRGRVLPAVVRLGQAARSAAAGSTLPRVSARTLIPRPETEWWTEKLIAHLREKFGGRAFDLLDLCAGSGAIGIAVLAHLPNARVTFAELVPEHAALIKGNIETNGLDAERAKICTGDLFENLPPDARYDVIATNPPYIPDGRALPESVSRYEPHEALFAGSDGLSFIRRIAAEAPRRLLPGGELWIECDGDHAEEAKKLLEAQQMEVLGHASTELHTDQYGRPRLLVSYWNA